MRNPYLILLALAFSGCASTLEYSRTLPTGEVERRSYRIGYGNEVTDSVAGFSVRPSDNVVKAGQAIAEYGIEKGGAAFQRQLVEGAVQHSR